MIDLSGSNPGRRERDEPKNRSAYRDPIIYWRRRSDKALIATFIVATTLFGVFYLNDIAEDNPALKGIAIAFCIVSGFVVYRLACYIYSVLK